MDNPGFDRTGQRLWRYTVASRLTLALVHDIDGDSYLEAVFRTDLRGNNKTVVYALGGDGTLLWSRTTGTSRYWLDDQMRVVALRAANMILAGEALPGQKVVLDSKGDAFTLKAKGGRG